MLERPPRRFRGELPTEPVMSDAPIPLPTSTRDLSEFVVEDNSPPSNDTPSRLEPRGWDGRNLSALKQSNYERGGHRISPGNQSEKGSLRDKSREELRRLFGNGKPDLAHPSLKGSLQGKSKQDAYAHYGKSKPNLQTPPLRGKPNQDLFASYGKCKPDSENPPPKSSSSDKSAKWPKFACEILGAKAACLKHPKRNPFPRDD